jgi:porphobilinogen synthase
MQYPDYRPRRLRRTDALRRLVRETHLCPSNLVLPLVVCPGQGIREPLPALPGVFRLSADRAAVEAREAHDLGIPGVYLTGLPERRDADGSEAWKETGPVQQAIRAVRKAVPDVAIMTEVCLCAYTSHGHCGHHARGATGVLEVDNDGSLEVLGKQALSQARAGADVLCLTSAMDGLVGFVRETLDEAALDNVAILACSAPFASGLSVPLDGGKAPLPDRATYRLDPANTRDALREMAMDVGEGADMVGVEPALPCLDVIAAAADEMDHPLCAIQSAAEHAVFVAAGERGVVDAGRVLTEVLVAIKRAGADFIVTHHAREVARALLRPDGARRRD